MKTSLVVGMGIGNLYATVLTNLGHGVVTVDSDPAKGCLLYTSPSPRDRTRSRMPSSA